MQTRAPAALLTRGLIHHIDHNNLCEAQIFSQLGTWFGQIASCASGWPESRARCDQTVPGAACAWREVFGNSEQCRLSLMLCQASALAPPCMQSLSPNLQSTLPTAQHVQSKQTPPRSKFSCWEQNLPSCGTCVVKNSFRSPPFHSRAP